MGPFSYEKSFLFCVPYLGLLLSPRRFQTCFRLFPCWYVFHHHSQQHSPSPSAEKRHAVGITTATTLATNDGAATKVLPPPLPLSPSPSSPRAVRRPRPRPRGAPRRASARALARARARHAVFSSSVCCRGKEDSPSEMRLNLPSSS